MMQQKSQKDGSREAGELKQLYDMSSVTYFFPPLFLNVFAKLILLVNIRGALQRYYKRDQKYGHMKRNS